jgi:hypothetical protein
MAHDIFISHSSKDKTIADAACACLESRGLRCWIAPRDIVAGADWSESIIDGINGAKVMVLILSSHANVSKQVLREIERAAHRGMAVLPFRVEDIPLSKSLEYFLSSAHWLDAWDGPLKYHLERLANNAAQIVDRQDAVRVITEPALPKRFFSASMLVAGVLALLLLGGATLLFVVASRQADKRAIELSQTSLAPSDVKAKLGIAAHHLSDTVARHLGAGEGGIYVAKVLPEQKADIRHGDIILNANDRRLISEKDWERFLESLAPEKTYRLRLVRDRKELEVSIQPISVPTEKLLEYSWKFDDAYAFGTRLIIKPDIGDLFSIKAAGNTILLGSVNDFSAWRRTEAGFDNISLPGTRYSCGDVSADGSLVVAVRHDTGALIGTDTRSGRQVLATEPLGGSNAKRLVVDVGRGFVIVIGEAGDVRLIDITSQEVTEELDFQANMPSDAFAWESPLDAVLSPSGKHLFTVHKTGCLVWDWRNAKVLRFMPCRTPIHGAAISEDWSRVAMFLEAGPIELWDVVLQKKVETFRGHVGGGLMSWGGVTFCGAHYLASAGSEDKSLRIWDIRQNALVWELLGGGYCISRDHVTGHTYIGYNHVVYEIEMPEFVLASQADLPPPVSEPGYPPLTTRR